MSRDALRRRYGRFFGPDPKRDVDDELAFHFAMRVDEFQRAGMTPGEARAAAMERFGSVDTVRNECVELGRRRLARRRRRFQMDALRQDVRYALRTIANNRGFSTTIALTMALGIAANTAVFSVAYGVLLRPLPYRDADRLVRLWSRNDQRALEFFSVSPADLADWRSQNRVFSGMAAFERQREATLTRGGEPQSVELAAVTPEMFSLLGTTALRGRTLLADDARDGATDVAVIGHSLWTTRFGSDSTLIGGDLTIDGRRVTVVGVMPPRFSVPGTPAEIWMPLSLAGASDDHGSRYLRVLARLAPGVTVDAARRQMGIIADRLALTYPASNAAWTVNIMAVPEMVVGTRFRRAVFLLLGVVGFVLLIACANSANLQLARAAGRRREIAIRAAVGATRGRITMQLLTESVLLALLAGVVGLALAYAGVGVLRAVGTETVPRLDDVRLDTPVLVFTAVVALGSGILFGLLPALWASRSDVGEVLKGSGKGEARTVGGRGVRALLVIAEVSLSLVLLIGTGLLMRSFVRLQAVSLGFEPAGLLVVPVGLPEIRYPDERRAATFYASLVDRVRQMPGVVDAAAVSIAPFAGGNPGNIFLPVGQPVPAQEQAPDANYRVITPGYLRTLGIRLLRGRDFSAADRQGSPPAVLISEAMAQRHWPNEDAIGRRIRWANLVDGPEYTIVGIVGDARYQSLETPEVRPMVYFAALAGSPRSMHVVVRGPDAASLAAPMRQALSTLDSSLPAPAVRPMEQMLGEATATPRFALVLFAIFAGAALLLAAIGIYGVMAYLVRQRTHELGLRIALGARPSTLVAGVVGGALRLTILGVVAGLAAAWALTRRMSALLFEVSATDPLVFAGIALLLTAVAVVASLVPARRAAKSDPLVAIRGP